MAPTEASLPLSVTAESINTSSSSSSLFATTRRCLVVLTVLLGFCLSVSDYETISRYARIATSANDGKHFQVLIQALHTSPTNQTTSNATTTGAARMLNDTATNTTTSSTSDLKHVNESSPADVVLPPAEGNKTNSTNSQVRATPIVKNNHLNVQDPPIASNPSVSKVHAQQAQQAQQARQAKEQHQQLFLVHATHGGWSNQLRCLQKAYYLAKATGRTLVAAPVLRHDNPIGSHLWKPPGRFLPGHKISSDFKLDYNLLQVYTKTNHKRNPYLSMSTIVDMKYTFPNVTTMDYRDFSRQHYDKQGRNTALQNWVLEDTYHHSNTQWILQQSPLSQSQPTVVHGAPVSKGKRYRDLATVAQGHSKHGLWTFLDAFYADLHPSVYGTHEDFHIRFSARIRHAAKTIHQNEWNSMPYISVHLRVGDGNFKHKAHKTMNQVMAQTKEQLQSYMASLRQVQQQRQQDHNNTQPQLIGIFIATDANPRQRQIFRERLEQELLPKLAPALRARIIYSHHFHAYADNLRELLVHPEIFLDQQVAACATIAYVGSAKSSFSGIIRQIRGSPGACD